MTTPAANEIIGKTAAELHGLAAVVTGSSSGIGRAIAVELAAGGAAVLVHGRANQAGAEKTAAAIRAAGGTAEVHLCDLTDAATSAAFVEAAWQWRGGVDMWINNAGADVLTGDAGRWTFERKLAALWRLDVEATMRISREVGRRMQSRGDGTIVNMGWDQAETGMAGDSGEMFAAVKGAVMAFTRSLAHSLAPLVRVNCVAPGWIKTEWGATASDYWQQRAIGEALRARWGTPEDVARAVRFLVSSSADFITGHVLPVNGGLRRSEGYPSRPANRERADGGPK